MSSLKITEIDTPLGGIQAVFRGSDLVSLQFLDRPPRDLPNQVPHEAIPIADTLAAFFNNAPIPSPPPLHPEGTPFQQSVWFLLKQIPKGQTRSYSDIARELGRPDAVRAVAQAIGRNPIHLLIPCHRVIGANGTLTGYAGGIWRKARLLELEGVSLPPVRH